MGQRPRIEPGRQFALDIGPLIGRELTAEEAGLPRRRNARVLHLGCEHRRAELALGLGRRQREESRAHVLSWPSGGAT